MAQSGSDHVYVKFLGQPTFRINIGPDGDETAMSIIGESNPDDTNNTAHGTLYKTDGVYNIDGDLITIDQCQSPAKVAAEATLAQLITAHNALLAVLRLQIVIAPPVSIAFREYGPPVNAVVNAVMAPFRLSALDDLGNSTKNDDDNNYTISLYQGETPADGLSGTLTKPLSEGWDDLQISVVGTGYSFHATDGMYYTAVSNPFDITAS